MDSIADALVEAVLFIAYRQYDDDAPVEEYEEEDIVALETLKALLASATDDEKEVLAGAIRRALSYLPPDHSRIPYYRAWMDNMFGDDTDLESPTLTLE